MGERRGTGRDDARPAWGFPSPRLRVRIPPPPLKVPRRSEPSLLPTRMRGSPWGTKSVGPLWQAAISALSTRIPAFLTHNGKP